MELRQPGVEAPEQAAGAPEPAPIVPARERILGSAYELFSTRGIQAVGIDSIIVHSDVARQTLYRHFSSKQELVIAFLERREQVWADAWLRGEVERRTSDPRERLLAVFDVFDSWFRRPDFEGCSFINVMLEYRDPADPVHQAAAGHLAGIRAFLEELARAAAIAEPEDFARRWNILMKGSIVAAVEGDADAAGRAQRIGRLVLASEPTVA